MTFAGITVALVLDRRPDEIFFVDRVHHSVDHLHLLPHRPLGLQYACVAVLIFVQQKTSNPPNRALPLPNTVL